MSYINNEIKDKLIADFGVDKTIDFCQMVSVMYRMLHDDLVKRGLASEDYDEFDYGFESVWWKTRCEELKRKKK